MCGGLARWLRVLGVDTSYTPGIEDGELVRQADADGRVVVSSDGKLFERRGFTTRRVRGVRLPVGLKLLEQVRFVVRELGVQPAFPRCTLCNGELEEVSRADVADVVPARSLIWKRDFYRCIECRHVFWEGTHWQRIRAAEAQILGGAFQDPFVSAPDARAGPAEAPKKRTAE
jgi:uncharacterized protein with PIN domain